MSISGRVASITETVVYNCVVWPAVDRGSDAHFPRPASPDELGLGWLLINEHRAAVTGWRRLLLRFYFAIERHQEGEGQS